MFVMTELETQIRSYNIQITLYICLYIAVCLKDLVLETVNSSLNKDTAVGNYASTGSPAICKEIERKRTWRRKLLWDSVQVYGDVRSIEIIAEGS